MEAAVIRYEAAAAPPDTFVAEKGGAGSVAYQDGVVRFATTSSTGSTGFYTDLEELDPKGGEPFALGMRVRVDVTGSSSSVYSGAVTGFFWREEQSAMFIGIDENSIRWGPNIGSLQALSMPLDGTTWNTIVVENDTTQMKLWANGTLLATRPHSDFSITLQATRLSFSANPLTVAEYDYIRFATGPDSMAQVAVPELSSTWLDVPALALLVRRTRRASLNRRM